MYMLVGLPGSGKSTWAKKKADKNKNIVICSSDQIREARGLAEDDKTIFHELQRNAKMYLNNGLDVIYDATNLSRKRRMSFLGQIPDHKKIAVLFMTPVDVCKSRQQIRDRKVPEEVIDRMFASIQLPAKHEGFHEIFLVKDKTIYESHIPHRLFDLNKIEQHNSHHSLTLGKHMQKTATKLLENPNLRHISELFFAAQMHDVGKFYVKNFTDKYGSQQPRLKR